jgi:hypothetical protein
MMNKFLRVLYPVLVAAVLLSGCSESKLAFSGAAALDDAQDFLEFGPRVSGSDGNRRAGDWLLERLRQAGWETFTDEGSYLGTPFRNVAARKGGGPIILLGAHYDSRRCADVPDGGCEEPVLGANDGGSGVAVLLELARTLDLAWDECQVWLVFFDAEDNGNLDGWEWIVGSDHFAQLVDVRREGGEEFRAMVLVDMVGAEGQVFLRESGSDPGLQSAIWTTASGLGFSDTFVDRPMGAMIDDHVPFRGLGIPSLDIIGWPYTYWHTTRDTFDKLDPDILERIGRTIEAWMEGGAGF